MNPLRVWLLAFVIVACSPATFSLAPFGLEGRTVLGAENVDHATQRNGMHSCPIGSFVTGVHLGRNQLLCSTYFGEYQGQEYSDSSSQQAGWHPDGESTMHGCPSGAVTGVFGGNLLACVPMHRGSLFVDKSNQRQGMHACPEGTVLVGLHANRNWLLCGTYGEVLSGREVQRNDMLSCPTGMFVTGLHIRANKLLCTPNFRWQTEVVDPSKAVSLGNGLVGCPARMAATGIHNERKLIACAPFPFPIRLHYRSAQRANMLACSLGSVMVGYNPKLGSDPIGGSIVVGIACGYPQ